ncbi:unnamed protein product [Dibothriocephalus latus]|uniref:Oligomycin sensitivity conferral protein n=1 Tax=Dibothriocephalus latus TaxID=60516 RepID=A0A3P7NNN6_DIBLA|nr:unnamed protein product [Dibothriocephalus latus]
MLTHLASIRYCFIMFPPLSVGQLMRTTLVLSYQLLSVLCFCWTVVLAENGRLGNLPKVLDTFNRIMTSHRGEVSCVVTTAKPLDKTVERELMTALSGFLEPGHKLNLHLKVDPQIIGGMILSIGDKYVDMSILRKIRSYKAVLEQPV